MGGRCSQCCRIWTDRSWGRTSSLIGAGTTLGWSLPRLTPPHLWTLSWVFPWELQVNNAWFLRRCLRRLNRDWWAYASDDIWPFSWVVWVLSWRWVSCYRKWACAAWRWLLWRWALRRYREWARWVPDRGCLVSFWCSCWCRSWRRGDWYFIATV